ncbi:metal ABC transporter permease [Nakamurella antarctica]|uniref:Metal ABC transporter permease n=1 Tax=Nakamurella antarctica TaxID=1902245 RepID=A0A3G8ZPA7_9ACTN|nr:metal ABC transporter permease [Nakamurella antarctica]AZI58978.1 metal ABC transporter permease [Nakamurella antarctica]
MSTVANWFSQFFSFTDFGQLLPLVSGSLIAAVIMGVMAGVVGPMVQARDLAFAVHGTAELSFTGAAAALLFVGSDFVVQGSIVGSVIAAIIFGLLGARATERNSSIGVVMAFGLGLGVMFIALYKGRSANKFGALVGQPSAVNGNQLVTLSIVAVLVLAAMAVLWRPLYFASVDTEVAISRGVPVRLLAPIFMVVLGLTVAMAVQIVGALLVLSLMITPTAAATRVTASPVKVVLLSGLFATVSAVGGVLLALSPGLPISPYVTTISFAIYLGCRVVGSLRGRRGWSKRGVVVA